MDTKLLEQWLRLTADALRGTEKAQQAMDQLGGGPFTPESLRAWWTTWAGGGPAGEAAPPEPRELEEMVEQWWGALGVVPRYRYVKLLKENEKLKQRLEEAVDTVHRLRERLQQQAPGAEAADRAGQAWEDATRQLLDAQNDWARAWNSAVFGGDAAQDEKK